MTATILAIDLGTSGCKAALVDLEGNVRCFAFREVATTILPGGGAEQDPNHWWRAVVDACQVVVHRDRTLASSILAVCANTQGEGTVPVDARGIPLSNAILWMDTRGASLVQKQLGGLVKIAGFAPSKLYRFIRLTGGAPSLTGKDPVGHMLWLKHEQPEIYHRTHKFLNVLDYLNFKLTGRMVSTVDSLVTSWITDNRSLDTVAIHPGLCKLIGISRDKIPSPVPCREVLGPIDDGFAKTVGLRPDTPVVAGAIDTTAAAVGSGALLDGDLHLYLGTSSWLGAHVPYKKTDVFSAIASLPSALPDRYLMIALQATACGNLNFLADKILYPDDLLSSGPRPENIYPLFDQLAETSPPGAKGLIYTPWIYGERAPIEDQTVRAGVHNLSLEHSRADLVRAVLEGIALNTRWILGPVDKFIGAPCRSIAAVGGGANSNVLCQILADVLGRSIRQIANPIEANLRGSAFIAAHALGKISLRDISRIVPVSHTYEPIPAHQAVYDVHFKEFVNLYRAQKKIHRRLNTFHGLRRYRGK